MNISSVPKSIREWFGSDDVLDQIESINNSFDFDENNSSIIVFALAKLEVKELGLGEFYNDLQTKLIPLVGEEKTQQAIQTINEKILAPIKTDLINFGILPTDWAPAATPTTQPAGPEISTEIKQPVAGEQPTEKLITTPSPAQTQPAEPEILRPSFKNEPFVFHQAEQPSKPTAQPEQPAFGIGYKITGPADVDVQAQEIPTMKSAPQTPPTAESKTRVVNYSEFRTPIEKTEAVQPSAEPVPTSQQAIPATSSQNIVNLKKNEQVSAEPNKENPENTINLRDLPL